MFERHRGHQRTPAFTQRGTFRGDVTPPVRAYRWIRGISNGVTFRSPGGAKLRRCGAESATEKPEHADKKKKKKKTFVETPSIISLQFDCCARACLYSPPGSFVLSSPSRRCVQIYARSGGLGMLWFFFRGDIMCDSLCFQTRCHPHLRRLGTPRGGGGLRPTSMHINCCRSHPLVLRLVSTGRCTGVAHISPVFTLGVSPHRFPFLCPRLTVDTWQ